MQLVSNSLTQVQVILLSPLCSLLFLFFFALFSFLWRFGVFFFFPSFSVWVFSSGLLSFLVEETPSAAQMIIAELQFHSSDSLRWGTVDFCVHHGKAKREREVWGEGQRCVSVTSFWWRAVSVRVCLWICQSFPNLLAPLMLFLKAFWMKLSEVALSYLGRHKVSVELKQILFIFSYKRS